jgi:DNA-binding beta-propeller fold protein YncE
MDGARILIVIAAIAALAAGLIVAFLFQAEEGPPPEEVPALETGYVVDPFWPKPLPNNWLIGQVSGVAVDSKDNIWILHRPKSLTVDEAAAAQNPPRAECCIPAPPVLVFSSAGDLLNTWEGAGEGYDWPETEHGIFIDHEDNVWIGGNGPSDHQVLKFNPAGKFLLQIGETGRTGGSNDTKLLGRPAEFYVDPDENEVYIADGYLNRRIIVFDARSGEYKRHWGAYGNKPDDTATGPYEPEAAPAQQFRTPVHAVMIDRDGIVYVCDRVNCRIQLFRKDGTFVKEMVIARNTLGPGSCWDMDFSPDPAQQHIYVVDGTNQRIWIVDRLGLQIKDSFGRNGRQAGQFHWVHSLATDSKGNIYTGEVDTGKRVQKFLGPPSTTDR